MSMERNVTGYGQGTMPNAGNLVTPRQLVSIRALQASLNTEAKSEYLHLFDSDLKALTVTSAARLIADLRARLIRQESRNTAEMEFVSGPMERQERK